MQAEKQLKDKKVYQKVTNSETNLSKLEDTSNKVFSSLKKTAYVTLIKGYIMS